MIESEITYNSLTFNDFADPNEFLALEKLPGLIGSADIREVMDTRAAQHGGKAYDFYLASRYFSIEGFIISASISGMNSKIAALKGALAVFDEELDLTWQATGEVGKQIACKPVGQIRIEPEGKKLNKYRFMIPMVGSDPRVYAQSLTSQNVDLPTATGGRTFPKTYPKTYGTVSVGGLLIVNNAGDIQTEPVIRIYGPVDNPWIKNVTDGNKFIKILLAVAAGDYLEIDFKEKTIMLNGTASRYGYISNDSEWWVILPGDNEIRYGANTYEAASYANIQFRSAWI